MDPSSINFITLLTVSGAALNSFLLCISVKFFDFLWRVKAQSKAESPPPTIAISLLKNFSIFLIE